MPGVTHIEVCLPLLCTKMKVRSQGLQAVFSRPRRICFYNPHRDNKLIVLKQSFFSANVGIFQSSYTSSVSKNKSNWATGQKKRREIGIIKWGETPNKPSSWPHLVSHKILVELKRRSNRKEVEEKNMFMWGSSKKKKDQKRGQWLFDPSSFFFLTCTVWMMQWKKKRSQRIATDVAWTFKSPSWTFPDYYNSCCFSSCGCKEEIAPQKEWFNSPPPNIKIKVHFELGIFSSESSFVGWLCKF